MGFAGSVTRQFRKRQCRVLPAVCMVLQNPFSLNFFKLFAVVLPTADKAGGQGDRRFVHAPLAQLDLHAIPSDPNAWSKTSLDGQRHG
jgi:hypothetical protein